MVILYESSVLMGSSNMSFAVQNQDNYDDVVIIDGEADVRNAVQLFKYLWMAK